MCLYLKRQCRRRSQPWKITAIAKHRKIPIEVMIWSGSSLLGSAKNNPKPTHDLSGYRQILGLLTLGRASSTAVEHMGCNLEVVDLNPAKCWSFSASSCYPFLLSFASGVSLIRSLQTDASLTECCVKMDASCATWAKTGSISSVR